MNKEYIVITTGPDGIGIQELTKDELLKEMQVEGSGLHYEETTYVDKLIDTDPMYWGECAVVIKGEIVKPKITEKVQVSHELDIP